MTDDLVCWKCGGSIAELPQPLGRYDICPSCRAELYVCRMCEFYDPRVAKSCRETVAEEVKDKERANFCGYFQLRPDAFQASDASAQEEARAQLEALFGGLETQQDKAAAGTGVSEVDEAKARLERLFGSDKKGEDAD